MSGYQEIVFEVDGFAICTLKLSTNKNEQKRREENLYLWGPEAMEFAMSQGLPREIKEKYKVGEMGSVAMWLAPRIANFYGYEYGAYREIVQYWTKDYSYFHLMKVMNKQKEENQHG